MADATPKTAILLIDCPDRKAYPPGDSPSSLRCENRKR
jgi:hypothetical protein